MKDVAKFVTVCTCGHRITLVLATSIRITFKRYLTDTAITISVIYKAFDNDGGFQRYPQMALPPTLCLCVPVPCCCLCNCTAIGATLTAIIFVFQIASIDTLTMTEP